MKKTKKPAKKSKTRTPAKMKAKKVPAKKQVAPLKTKVPIEEADLDSMTDNEILSTYAEEIEEHGDWIWREQDRGGPTYSRQQCIEQAKKEVLDGDWPPRRTDFETSHAELMKLLGFEK